MRLTLLVHTGSRVIVITLPMKPQHLWLGVCLFGSARHPCACSACPGLCSCLLTPLLCLRCAALVVLLQLVLHQPA
jgi:hypothetical protein